MSKDDYNAIAALLLTHRFHLAVFASSVQGVKGGKIFTDQIAECNRLEKLCREEAKK